MDKIYMNSNDGVNKVFLLGDIVNEPEWCKIDGEKMLCFKLVTPESIKKNGKPHEHLEYHNIKLPVDILENGFHLRKGDHVYLQGKIQTKKLFENNVKLYRSEILATSIEQLKTASKEEASSILQR